MIHFCLAGNDQRASSVTQIWYSLRLSEEDNKLIMRTLEELIHASSLEELTKGAMKIEQDHLHKLVQVWRAWLELGSREEDWVTEARQLRFKNDPPVSKKGVKLYLEQIPKEHEESASDWFDHGILFPKGSRKDLSRENVTLTGLPFIFDKNAGSYHDRFNYFIESSVIPFSSWDYKAVKQHSYSASLLKMYSQYISRVLEECAMKLATRQVTFHFLLCDCM